MFAAFVCSQEVVSLTLCILRHRRPCSPVSCKLLLVFLTLSVCTCTHFTQERLFPSQKGEVVGVSVTLDLRWCCPQLIILLLHQLLGCMCVSLGFRGQATSGLCVTYTLHTHKVNNQRSTSYWPLRTNQDFIWTMSIYSNLSVITYMLL